MSRRVATLLVASLLAAALAIVGLTLHVPYVVLSPGPVTDTLGTTPGGSEPLIQISGHPSYPTTGHLDLTTVLVTGGPPAPITLGQALRGWFDDTVAVLPEELIYPTGKSTQQVQQENAQEMAESQDHATTAALRYLGIPVTTRVTVGGLQPKGPAQQAGIAVGDVLLRVDGTAVASEEQLRAAITRHQPGDRVTVTYQHGSAKQTAVLTLAPAPDDPKRPIIGVTPSVRSAFPFTVKIGLQDVGGPSAGLMFALGIIDRLTPEDITGGRFIAGTGEIGDDGTVGPIGGVQQKVIAARRAGARFFLTPADNCASAADNRPAGLTLIEVHNLKDAVNDLALLRSGKPVPQCH